jgi:hypothetical protein
MLYHQELQAKWTCQRKNGRYLQKHHQLEKLGKPPLHGPIILKKNGGLERKQGNLHANNSTYEWKYISCPSTRIQTPKHWHHKYHQPVQPRADYCPWENVNWIIRDMQREA